MGEEFERTQRSLLRYARASFDLIIAQDCGYSVILQYNPTYSRSKQVFDDRALGVIASKSQADLLGTAAVDQEQVRRVVNSLREVITEFETPPIMPLLDAWVEECFDGRGLPLVPVAVHQLDCFSQFVDRAKNPLYRCDIATYRSNDPESLGALDALCNAF